MAAAPRRPAKPKASRASRDMHDKDPEVRKEAAEVLALIPRKRKSTPRKKK
jgi:hypothetical protein